MFVGLAGAFAFIICRNMNCIKISSLDFRSLARRPLTGNVSLKFNVERVQSNSPVPNGGTPNGDDATYSCEVALGDRVLFKIEGYSTGEIAEVTAANKAIDILNGKPA